jgi:glutamine amidotransferase
MRVSSVLEVGFGNLPSLERVLRQIEVSVKPIFSAEEIRKAEVLIIPGVGSFEVAMSHLEEHELSDAIRERCLELKKPTLGICLGAQILLSSGTEGGFRTGLGIFEGAVAPFNQLGIEKSHTGWDQVYFSKDCLSFEEGNKYDFFFNHDYFFSDVANENIFATCDWLNSFTVGLNRASTYAVQFHPEKSQSAGKRFLQNFFDRYYV